MAHTSAAFLLCLLGVAVAQQAGTNEIEGAPKMSLKQCTAAGGCVESQRGITLDANWRWVHNTDG
eukprot:CAMPEP_0195091802 /NCGR_PEP_ID=MMETSP0448-20130528/35093_1 /TAXON_ID=66468 /ORGANISM="Heterocapsa triquestra, Strain CCMP 448" /LENGTH=64 /DNA_ID=CAMNT_0040125649 /DNA_START=61 /DNA_END=251 /DNA_ORIENTATION=-